MCSNRGSYEHHEPKHRHTRVPKLSSLRKPRLKRREETRRGLIGLSRLEEQLILERERSKRGSDGDQKHVDVGDKNDSPLGGDGSAIAQTSEHAPLG